MIEQDKFIIKISVLSNSRDLIDKYKTSIFEQGSMNTLGVDFSIITGTFDNLNIEAQVWYINPDLKFKGRFLMNSSAYVFLLDTTEYDHMQALPTLLKNANTAGYTNIPFTVFTFGDKEVPEFNTKLWANYDMQMISEEPNWNSYLDKLTTEYAEYLQQVIDKARAE
ncbi:MAG: hypothetical protein INQ03_25925 [Candidatus Heimdallarchaeota archaeon]|nr:hypothetical protein [Candidatus Heimdallarchaeota archaeon]